MSMLRRWIGKVLVIRREGDCWFKPQRVRIEDVEIATPLMDSRNPSGIWFWATTT